MPNIVAFKVECPTTNTDTFYKELSKVKSGNYLDLIRRKEKLAEVCRTSIQVQ